MTIGRLLFGATICCATFADPAPAAAGVFNDAQVWADLFVSAPVTRNVLVSGEVISRTVDDVSREGQIETRLEIGHPFGPRLTGWIGWIHVATLAPVGPNGVENQAVEQLNWTPGKLGHVAVALRTRLEQRAIRGVGETSWRVREQARFVMPLKARGVALVAWGEPFVALNTTRAQPYLLERVRGFVGVNVPAARHLDLEVGYLNEYLPRAAGKWDNHVLSGTLSLRW